MYRFFLKRGFDIVFSLLVSPIFFALLVFLIPLMYLGDRGTLFYNAKRLGKNGKVFKMYKFRTMILNAPDLRNEDGSTYNSEDDPRLTRIGRLLRKTSIDELPQILNILKGDMSLIGPRPDLANQNKFYDITNEVKFRVKPGLTGYAQVKGRNTISWEEKTKLDRYYVENLNAYLDFKIFFLTIFKILKAEGVNKHGKKNSSRV
jgi:lipopolysaccharide/colanic/teichoic acid biosynthesis glycosyltransferase